MIHRRHELRAEKILQEKLFSHEKVEMLWNNVVCDILGDGEVTGVRLRESVGGDGRERVLSVSGIFVAIGHVPETGFVSVRIAILAILPRILRTRS